MKIQVRRIRAAASRLRPMYVREFRTLGSGDAYAVCPRCRVSMDREYIRYCSYCGQKLSWVHFAQLRQEIQKQHG